LQAEADETEDETMVAVKQENIDKLNKIAEIIAVLDNEKDPEVIATKLLSIM
jgi:hypothetical protein